MKGSSDIEDVKNDPAYSVTNDEVRVMISDYQVKRSIMRILKISFLAA